MKMSSQQIPSNAASVSNAISGMFPYPKETKLAYNQLLNRGYTKHEIKVILSEQASQSVLYEDSLDNIDDSNLEQTIRGIKVGGIGGFILGIAFSTGYFLLTAGSLAVSPYAVLFSGIAVFVLLGGIFGLLFGPYMSFKLRLKSRKRLFRRNATLSFIPHNQMDAAYFQKAWNFKLN